MSLDPNFLDQDKSAVIVVTGSVFTGLATLTCILRFVARRLTGARYGLDDYTIFFALALVYGLLAVATTSTRHGIGRHIEAVSPSQRMMALKLLYFYQILYVVTPATIKLSILFLYKRIFIGQKFIWIVHTLMGIVSIWLVVTTFISIFNCTPINAFWTSNGRCFDFKDFGIGYAVVNIVTDFAIWILPLPIVWKLQLPTAQRVGLMLIFALGLFDCGAAMARLLSSILSLGSRDFTWDYVNAYMWSIVEPAVGVMCACLPTIRIVIVAVIPDSLRQAFSGKSNSLDRGTGSLSYKNDTHWPRTATYNEIHGPLTSTLHSSSRHHKDDDLEMLASSGGIMVSQDFRVDEESVHDGASDTTSNAHVIGI